MTVESLSFTVPALGGQSLSSNASGAKRHPHAIKAAKDALGEAAYFAALQAFGPQIPSIEGQVDIWLDYHICYRKRPQDGLYRFRDPSNGGGDVAKVIVDYGLVKTGVIGDDDWKHVRYFVCGITPVETLEEERVEVTVRPVEPAPYGDGDRA